MKKLLTIDIADNNGHKFGFNATTNIDNSMDIMDKIKQAVSSQLEPLVMPKIAEVEEITDWISDLALRDGGKIFMKSTLDCENANVTYGDLRKLLQG